MGDRLYVTEQWKPFLAAVGLKGCDDFLALEGEGVKRTRTFRVRLVTLRAEGAVRRFYVKGYFYQTWRDVRRGLFHNTLFGRPRVERELRSLEALVSLGFREVSPVAFGVRRRWGFQRAGFIMTEAMCGAESLDVLSARFLLDQAPDRRAARSMLTALAAWVRRLHECGYVDNDLFWRDILMAEGVDGDYRFGLIDSPRSRVSGGPQSFRRRVRDLAALASAADLVLSRTEQIRFLREYLGQTAPAMRRRWVAAIRRARERDRPSDERKIIALSRYFASGGADKVAE